MSFGLEMSGPEMRAIREAKQWTERDLAAWLYRHPDGPVFVRAMEMGRLEIAQPIALAMAGLRDAPQLPAGGRSAPLASTIA